MFEFMVRRFFLIAFLLQGISGFSQSTFLQPEYWRKQALKDVLPHWTNKAVDPANGMFYTNLDREWKQFGSFDQSPAMIARHLFGYSAGFLMSGDTALLNRGRQLFSYLQKHAWDKKHGGWYDLLDRHGKPVKETKTTFNQEYCITGLTMYYFVTRDPSVLKTIERANELLETKVWDQHKGGYFDVMKRDWRVDVPNKSFSSVITPVSGYLFYLHLATRDKKYVEQIERIMKVVDDKMKDPKTGWILESFDASWKYIYPAGGIHEINIGHNIETAWMYLRLYLLTKNESHLQSAKKLWDISERYGFDASTGCWFATVSKTDPTQHPDLSYWWIQAYGNMVNLIWYHLEGDSSILQKFEKGAEFWDTYFIDKEHGDAYQGVSTKGEKADPVKANLYKASYHNLENSLLCYMYISLWIENKQPQLFFAEGANIAPQTSSPIEQ